MILIVIYFCIKSKKCFCDKTGDDREETPDIQYSKVSTEDPSMERSSYDSPIPGLSKKPSYTYSTPNLPSQKIGSSDDEEPAPGVSKIEGPIDPPGSKRDNLRVESMRSKRSKSMESLVPEIGKLRLTVQYSEKNLFLLLAVHEIVDLKTEDISGVNQVRISLVLLPTKKHRSKTKYTSVTNPVFDSSYKYSNVTRNDLFRSAVRFRMYGRHGKLGVSLGKERLIGEMIFQLADVAQNAKFTAIRPFKLAK
eukprot:gene20383-22392_t